MDSTRRYAWDAGSGLTPPSGDAAMEQSSSGMT
jgi:hypothetical protein